jgi:hypothetical protein
MEDRQIFYSLITGKVYDLPVEEGKKLNKYEIPVSHPPKTNCKKCHGRGHVGHNITVGYYVMCQCLHKHVEFSKIKKDGE